MPERFKTVPEQILFGGFYLGFLGDTGTGKTSSMTWFAYWVNKRIIEEKLDVSIYTNYTFIDLPKHGLEWKDTKLEHPDELLDIEVGFAFIDEIWRWCLDSYGTAQNAKRQYDDIASNARKRGIGFFASSQRLMRIDPNFRENIHYLVYPTLFYDEWNRPSFVNVAIVKSLTGVVEESFDFDPNPVFQMYDTTEPIERHASLERIDLGEFAEKFVEWNSTKVETQEGETIVVKQPVSQAVVNLFLRQTKLRKRNLYDELTKEERTMFRVLCKRLQP